MKFKKLRKTLSPTERITMFRLDDGEVAGYTTYESIDDIPNIYNDCKVIMIYSRSDVTSSAICPCTILCIGVEVD